MTLKELHDQAGDALDASRRVTFGDHSPLEGTMKEVGRTIDAILEAGTALERLFGRYDDLRARQRDDHGVNVEADLTPGLRAHLDSWRSERATRESEARLAQRAERGDEPTLVAPAGSQQ